MSRDVQRNTFYLLGCERCARFEPPPPPFECRVARASTEPLRCETCDEILLLIECFVADETTMWQERPGAVWRHVAYPETLPDGPGRHRWTR